MTLIKSISGIRGTIGGNPEDGLQDPFTKSHISLFV